MNKLSIDLLRHGEAANGQKLRGKTDDPLSPLGWQQMRDTAASNSIPWQKIISSNLQRCQEFATELSRQHRLPLELDHRFQEFNFGRWDGRLFDELYGTDDADDFFQFLKSPSSISPPEGETYQLFKTRVLTAWNELLASLAKQKIEHCLLVTHGGVMKVIISEVLGIPEENLFRLEVPHACLSRITKYDNEAENLSFHNGAL